MYSMTLAGAEVLPVEVSITSTYSTRLRFEYVGNLSVERQRELSAKLPVLLDDSMLLSPAVTNRRIVIEFTPTDVPIGVETELAVLSSLYEHLCGVAYWSKDYCYIGEVSSTGRILPLSHPLAFIASKRDLVVPKASADEMLGRTVYSLEHTWDLQYFVGLLTYHTIAGRVRANDPKDYRAAYTYTAQQKPIKVAPPICPDISVVKGQQYAKRALEIAAAGGHNLLMIGPPGEGKSLLAKTMPGILPPLTGLQAVAVTHLHRMKGLIGQEDGLIGTPPFQIVDSNTTLQALLGGGHGTPSPGSLALANHGILYLDELHQVTKQQREALRGPLEDKYVVVNRVKFTYKFPCDVIFLTSTNPCPCGYYKHPTKKCRCSPARLATYQAKLSGPLMDRIPLVVWVDPLDVETYRSNDKSESSIAVRERVTWARKIARARGYDRNDSIPPQDIREVIQLTKEAEKEEDIVVARLGLSTRARDHLLRVARTVADIFQSKEVLSDHVKEAGLFINRELLA